MQTDRTSAAMWRVMVAMLAGTATTLAQGPAAVLAQGPGGPPGQGAGGPGPRQPGAEEEKPDFPPIAEVLKGFEKVVTSADGQASLYTLWKREKDQHLYAELPRDFGRQRIFIATTIAGGAPITGIQIGETYAYWRRYDKRLALVEPNVTVRAAQGDAEGKKTEERVFTDRVLLEVPIVAIGAGGGPIIDLAGVLTAQSDKFFGFTTYGANRNLVKIAKAKAFPKNVEVAFEMPDRSGRLVTLHYSISEIPERGSYQPREADARVGYFTTSYRDISRNDKDTQWVRYINRWQIEKRDPKLKLSPPKQPIVFFIDAATPVQYRRWVREGVLAWNKAFEKVGIVEAIQVNQQDAATGEHMEKDPEDVRYNFIRWTSAGLGFAIGPSRVHPETGQILDADVVIDDGFIRGWTRSYQQLLGELAMTGYGSDVLAWLDSHPQWDPRIALAAPGERDVLIKARQMARARDLADAVKGRREGGLEEAPVMALRSGEPLVFNPIGSVDLAPRGSDLKGLRCSANLARSIDVATMRLSMEVLGLIEAAQDEPKDESDKKDKDKDKDKEKKKDEPKEQLLDGMPESFVGPLLADLVSHEVGHTLGLRHNFKASSIHELAEINAEGFKGKQTITGSVMDYTPININMKDGPVQGDFAMVGIGPYDQWAIEYGYSFEKDLKPIVSRVSEANLPYATDEDVSGPDPQSKMFDLGKDSLNYAESSMRLVRFLRPKILEKLVKDGESWQKARDTYNLLLARHIGAVRIASYYIGGASVNRDHKGDPGNRPSLTPYDMAQQRRALKFVIENTFKDEAFGLDRELLARLGVEKWYDEGGFRNLFESPDWPIHDRVLAVQGSALTMLMNPTTLQRVYDNEFRLAPGQDALTLPELLDTVTSAIFTELTAGVGRSTAREPAVSSLRRNLQREYLSRLIDLATSDDAFTAAYKPIATLVTLKLRDLQAQLEKAAEAGGLDPYTKANFAEAAIRVKQALSASFIYNADKIGGGGGIFFILGREGGSHPTSEEPSGSAVPGHP